MMATRNQQRKSTGQRTRRAVPNAWRRPFLAALSQNGNVTDACEIANVDRSTAYKQRNKDEAFAVQWDEAIDIAIDRLESEAHRRAALGTRKGIYYKGDLVATELEYSDQLMITLLKAHRPDKYKDRLGIEYSMPPELVKLLKEYDLKSSEIFQGIIDQIHEDAQTGVLKKK